MRVFLTIDTEVWPRHPGWPHQPLEAGDTCDRQLQADMNQWAAQSLRTSDWARSCYDSQRRRGKTHNQALRALANKWIAILQAVIKTRRPYDEDLHVRHLVDAGVPWARQLAPKPLEAA